LVTSFAKRSVRVQHIPPTYFREEDMNKFTKMLIVAAALLPALCTAQVASQYRVTQVGGSVLNDLGQSAGISAGGSLQVWDRNGVLTASAGNVRQATLTAMNTDSIVVGSAVLPEYSDFAQPLIWKIGGTAQRLDVKGTGGVALDINNHGDIVGTIRGIKSNGEGGTIGFLQHDGVNTYFEDFTPIALNEKGQILGGRSGSWDYWIWDKGELTELTNTGFPENANIRLFNSQGYAAGGYSAQCGPLHREGHHSDVAGLRACHERFEHGCGLERVRKRDAVRRWQDLCARSSYERPGMVRMDAKRCVRHQQ
jgi:hypothetical protein